jgi:hypothetical protein
LVHAVRAVVTSGCGEARAALAEARATESGMAKHRKLGLVDGHEELIERLREIENRSL